MLAETSTMLKRFDGLFKCELNWYLNTLEYLPFAPDMTLVSHVQLVIHLLKMIIKTTAPKPIVPHHMIIQLTTAIQIKCHALNPY